VFFALSPDLAEARVKDPDLPFQRIILILGLVAAFVRVFTRWLPRESVRFEVVILSEPGAALDQERELLDFLFGAEREAGVVTVRTCRRDELERMGEAAARKTRCRLVTISASAMEPPPISVPFAQNRFRLDGPAPRIDFSSVMPDVVEESPCDRLQSWQAALRRLLEAAL
jgi:hypothetical protein